jgi:hypothetical protein
MVRLDIIFVTCKGTCRKRATRIHLRIPLKSKKSQLYDEYKYPLKGEKGDSNFSFVFLSLVTSLNLSCLETCLVKE